MIHNYKNLYPFIYSFFFIVCFVPLQGQSSITKLVETCKNDTRGPYKDIRWFCNDGSTKPAKEPCGEIGGNQRGRYKDEIIQLGQSKHVFLGQILSGTQNEDFWDAKKDHSRLKQYLIERYLFDNDNGWIQRKSQFYRGAVQSEDEEEWGKLFFEDLFSKILVNEDNYFLIREAIKTIPHGGDTPGLAKIRALSKEIAELDNSFEDLRIKIHGNPQYTDLSQIKIFKPKKNNSNVNSKLAELVLEYQTYYELDLIALIRTKVKKLGSFQDLKKSLIQFTQLEDQSNRYAFFEGVDIINEIKTKIFQLKNPKDKLILFDISILLEQIVLKNPSIFKNDHWHDYIEAACYLSQLGSGGGYLNQWEMEEMIGPFSSRVGDDITIEQLEIIHGSLRKGINWSTSLFLSFFEKDINTFSSFEPLSKGFYDDRIRSSAILTLGRLESQFSDQLEKLTNRSQEILGRKMNGIIGLNPGVAKGKIYIGDEHSDTPIDKTGIYLFQKPPADLEPVAGILSISEGNVVSHLQLLARNLGIPNTTIDNAMFNYLSGFEGKEIFYAVSSNGNVLIKETAQMNAIENSLIAKAEVNEDIIEIPIDEIKLDNEEILNIRNLNASSTGIYCGPKAANFAELKNIFPDNLVEGFVIPFGVFKSHMLQKVPGKSHTYWEYLESIFLSDNNADEQLILNQLDTLRGWIKEMPLKPNFQSLLETSFNSILGKKMGSVPVFLRSDTNMEDLKDFTGAGLNLTVFNVMEGSKILQGIKDVWASPYSERSYKWRQKYLKNPEHVYPSILVIPSVYVDRSGVLITKNIQNGSTSALTVAMSRGVGGAVDGQSSETRILNSQLGSALIAPSRDRTYKSLTATEGTQISDCSLASPIITHSDIREIWKMTNVIHKEIPRTGMPYPYDVEFGFVGEKLWIFQIRPFVENKKANNLNYLQNLNGSSQVQKKTIDLYAPF